MFVGTHREIIILRFLRRCRIPSIYRGQAGVVGYNIKKGVSGLIFRAVVVWGGRELDFSLKRIMQILKHNLWEPSGGLDRVLFKDR